MGIINEYPDKLKQALYSVNGQKFSFRSLEVTGRPAYQINCMVTIAIEGIEIPLRCVISLKDSLDTIVYKKTLTNGKKDIEQTYQQEYRLQKVRENHERG